MAGYFALEGLGEPFRFFSLPHLSVLCLVIVINMLIFLGRDRLKGEHTKRSISLWMAFLLLLSEILLRAWEAYNGIWSVQGSLPLHLCSVSLIMCIVMLVSREYSIFEITYFWGLGGASQALLTPDLTYPFPHFVFFLFMGSHALIVTACLWMRFVEGYRPGFNSLLKSFAALNLYMLVIAAINTALESNYLYICQKPGNPSLLDYLGPWPWYILVLEAVAFAAFLLYYMPFAGTSKKEDLAGKEISKNPSM